jgi:hypothetical protein
VDATFTVSRISSGVWCVPGFHRTPTRVKRGTSSLRMRSRWPATSSGASICSPVILRPGLARLATMPAAAGSPLDTMTTGTISVAIFAASAAGSPRVTITSGWSATSSTARLRNRSGRPSAERYSMTALCPSTYPRSLSASRNAVRLAAFDASSTASSTPIRYIFPARSPAAVSGMAKPPATEVSRKRRRFMPGR